MGTDKRERQKQARQAKIEEVRRQDERAASRKRGMRIGLFVAGFIVVAIVLSVALSGDNGDDGDDDVAAGDTTTSLDESDDVGDESPVETDTPERPVAELPELDEDGIFQGATDCPADDGSSERTIDFDGPFAPCIDPDVDYVARFDTTEGEVVVDLLEAEMPNTVNNFVSLARYGYYDETVLFRTDPSIDIIQGGSPHTQDNRDQGPGFTIFDEGGDFSPDGGQGPFTYEEGQLIMARSAGPNSSSAQFFFSTGPNVSLLDSQGTYLLFGQVTEGLDVLQEIIGLHEADDSGLGGAPSREVVINKVEILEG